MIRLVTVFFVIVLSSRSAAQTADTGNWNSFTDTAGHFIAKYPPDWKNKIKEGNRVFFTSPAENEADQFFENINISVTRHPSFGNGVKIQDLFPAVTEQIKPAFRDFISEGERRFKWNNMDAVEIIYTGFSKAGESIRVRMIQWFCFYKAKLYTVTYTAAADNQVHTATAKTIMGNIVFK